MTGALAWVAGSGVVQGVIIGATLAFLTATLLLDADSAARALVIGRVHIGADGDREAAARIAQQLRLSPV